jgi:hypothetical protein
VGQFECNLSDSSFWLKTGNRQADPKHQQECGGILLHERERKEPHYLGHGVGPMLLNQLAGRFGYPIVGNHSAL